MSTQKRKSLERKDSNPKRVTQEHWFLLMKKQLLFLNVLIDARGFGN